MSESTGTAASEAASTQMQQQLLELLARMDARMEVLERKEQDREEAATEAQRKEVLRNPRHSLPGGVVNPSVSRTTTSISSGGQQFSPNPAYVPHRQGRLTMSPERTPIPSHSDPHEQDDDVKQEQQPFRQDKTESEEERRRGEERLMRRVEGPASFSGDRTKDKIPEVRDWVDAVDAYLDLVLGSNADGVFALSYVSTRLVGPAHDWLKAKKLAIREAVNRGGLPGHVQAMTWAEAKVLLVEEFESHQYRVLKKMELQALRLGQGECKTLPLFNAAFDKLSRSLYPLGTDLEASLMESVLADEYSNALQSSDYYMWRDIVKTGPRTLAQWKASTAVAWSAREVLKKNDRQEERREARNVRPSYIRPSAVNEMSTAVRDEDRSPQEPEPDEGQPPVTTAHQIQTRSRIPGPRLLSDEEYKKVRADGRCLQCYKKGHRIGDDACKEKGKPRRRPAAGELNL
jgi:hypothetical protein